MAPIANTIRRRTKRNATPICSNMKERFSQRILTLGKRELKRQWIQHTYSPRLDNNYQSWNSTKQKQKTNYNKNIYTTRKFPIIILPANRHFKKIRHLSHSNSCQFTIKINWQIQESVTYHLSNPQQSDSTAGMQTKGSKAAKKSPFVGTWSSLVLITSK